MTAPDDWTDRELWGVIRLIRGSLDNLEAATLMLGHLIDRQSVAESVLAELILKRANPGKENHVKTPSDLKTARYRLGLTTREAAVYLGLPADSDIGQLERAKQHNFWEGYADALSRLDDAAMAVERRLERSAAAYGVILVYGNDDEMLKHEMWSAPIRFASVLRAAAARVQARFHERGQFIPIVEFSRDLFDRWRADGGDGSSMDWAKHRVTEIEARPGLPTLKQIRR